MRLVCFWVAVVFGALASVGWVWYVVNVVRWLCGGGLGAWCRW